MSEPEGGIPEHNSVDTQRDGIPGQPEAPAVEPEVPVTEREAPSDLSPTVPEESLTESASLDMAAPSEVSAAPTLSTPRITHFPRCPVCAVTDAHSVGVWGEYRLWMCGGCELVYVVPRPAPAQPETSGAFTGLMKSLREVLGYGSDFVSEEDEGLRAWEMLAPSLAKHLPSPGRLLDICCGRGDFLAQAQAAGWSVVGIETSEKSAQEAREQYGLDVRPEGIREGDLEEDSFDLVTVRRTLEHLVEPGRALQEAQRALRPGGWLWIETLNWNSRGRIRRGMRWEQIRPPERLNYFAPRSLCTAVERAGLEVVTLHTGPGETPPPAGGLRARLSIRLVGLLGWGEWIRMWARKPPQRVRSQSA